jgi:hypothetical protein
MNVDYDQLFENKLADLIDIGLPNEDGEEFRESPASKEILVVPQHEQVDRDFKFSEFLNDSQ